METEPKENSELLQIKNRNFGRELNHAENSGITPAGQFVTVPPDGGIRAYLVVLASFFTNGLIFGIINSYSIIYRTYLEQLKDAGVSGAESRASLAGALTMGVTFLMSPLAGALTVFLGMRLTAVLGGSIAVIALVSSSFSLPNVDVFCFTYGFLYGLGASLAYTPSLAILGHYFKKYLGIVNGIVTIGSSIFTVIMAPLIQFMINNYGLEWMMRLLAVLTIGVALCGLMFEPPVTNRVTSDKKDKTFKSLLKKSVTNVRIWKIKSYKFWALSMPVAMFGYLVPYVHLGELMKVNFSQIKSDKLRNVPLQCIAVTSGIGRLLFGYLADNPRLDRILLQQVSFYCIGLFTIALPFIRSYELLISVALGMGLFDGAFISLIGPIAIDFCGNSNAAQAIGCMLGMVAFPLSLGPPIAGYIYKLRNSYILPFILAGISPIIGSTLMFSVRIFGEKRNISSNHANGRITPLSDKQQGTHQQTPL